MSTSNYTQEDAILSSVIETGAPRPAPLNLARTVKFRLRILTAIHRENRHFHIMTGVLISGIVTLILLGCFAPYSTMVNEWAARNLPGGMGYYDYFLLSLDQTFFTTLSVFFLILSILGVGLQHNAFRNKKNAPK